MAADDIRGLPETTAPKDIVHTLCDTFRMILELPASTTIEIDSSHRVLRPPSEDPEYPRDVICKLHKYTLKDRIMQRMHKKPYYD